VTVGLYVPGRSPVHRTPAAWKVVAVFAGSTLVVAIDDARVLGVASACVCLLYGIARIGWRVALRQVRPVVPVLLVLCAVQWMTAGAASAVLVTLRLVTVLLLAMLVTLTTPVSEMVEVIERACRPLERFGVQTGKVSLAISMTFRFIPLLTQVGHEVREAQRARGLERNLLALAVPLLVRALHTAEQVAEAIDARGS
jgi:biotin transport system permease protein